MSDTCLSRAILRLLAAIISSNWLEWLDAGLTAPSLCNETSTHGPIEQTKKKTKPTSTHGPIEQTKKKTKATAR